MEKMVFPSPLRRKRSSALDGPRVFAVFMLAVCVSYAEFEF